MEEEDCDEPRLSADTLAALQEFYSEQNLERERLVQSGQGETFIPREDWQLSQFWYDENTAKLLGQEVLTAAGDLGRIACLSAPSTYKYIREQNTRGCEIKVFEYDRRFECYGEDYIFYDYRSPLDIPKELQNSFDIVLADPPFLSEECLEKTSQSIKFLTKGKILLCTGAVMESLAIDLLGVKVCQFQPKHSNQLQNEFKCFSNYQTSAFN